MRAISLMLLMLVSALRAETITGKVLVRKQLTKRSISNSVSIYDRGAVVPLHAFVPSVSTDKKAAAGKDIGEDPLDFERERVVIWLESQTDAEVPAPTTVVMQQIGRRFLPELVVIPVGSNISFPNLDPIFHNVFSLSKPKTFDLGNYVKGDSRSVTFGKPGIIYVNCHLHASMTAAIVVTPGRWYAKAGRNGQYALTDVPPGEYTAVAWHKAAGFFRKTVQVQTNHDAVLDFFIPIGENETLQSPRLRVPPETR